MKKMAKKIVKHLKKDIKEEKHMMKEDKDLIKSMKKNKKHEKHETKKHEKEEHMIKKAMHHKDKLGEGAKKRSHLKPKDKMKVVMAEFKDHKLRSGSGQKVENPKQALAIAYSESRKARKKRK